MDLSEVEVAAGQLLEQKKRLKTIDSELSTVQLELKEQPRRSEKDKKFYSLIGLDYEVPSHTAQREGQLRKEKQEATDAMKRAQGEIVRGFSSSDLIVPLDPTPMEDGKRFTFRYRYGATYPKTLEALSDIIGLPSPLRIDQVVIGPEMIEVEEVDAFFAKEKLVEAFGKIQKTVALKLGPRPQA
jgi:hypothetical protein